MVDGRYEKKGVGKEIIEELLRKCEESGIEWIEVLNLKGVEGNRNGVVW